MSAKGRYFFIHVTVPENEGQHEDGEDDEREVPAQVHNLSPNNNFNKNILFQFILRVFYKYCPGVFVLLRSLHPSSRLAFRDSNKVLILSYRLRLECPLFRRNTNPAEFRFYEIPYFTEFREILQHSVSDFRRNRKFPQNSAGIPLYDIPLDTLVQTLQVNYI